MKSIIVAALLACCTTVQAADLDIAEIRSFHVGGRQVTLQGLPVTEVPFSPGSVPFRVDPNGDYQTGQMYVQSVVLARPRARYPLLLWHGGGLTGVSWETTPDGRPGFQMFFLRAGHSVYVSDSAERGRSSFSRSPEIYKTSPLFRTGNEAWSLFRIGPDGSYTTDPASRTAFTNTQFPIEAFSQFGRQTVPRWLDSDPMIQAAYDELVQKVCPCVIMTHSQGGLYGFQAALRAPDKVKALISLEPGTPPNPKLVTNTLKGVPFLIVWGDNIDKSTYWTKKIPPISDYRDALVEAGAVVDWIDLPKQGIMGNSHMVMMDRNSDRVADLIQDWMVRQNLMQ